MIAPYYGKQTGGLIDRLSVAPPSTHAHTPMHAVSATAAAAAAAAAADYY